MMTDYSSSYNINVSINPHQTFDTTIDIPSINCYQNSSCSSLANQATTQSSQIYHLNQTFSSQSHNQLTNSNSYRSGYESGWPNQGNLSSINANNSNHANNNSSFMNSFHTGFNYKLYSPPIDDTDNECFNTSGQRGSKTEQSGACQFSSLVTAAANAASISNDKRKQRRIRTTFSSLQLKELEKGSIF